MIEHPSAEKWSLTPAEAEHVDRVCNDFEANWKAVATGGSRPRLEDYVVGVASTVREVLLQELLDVEVAYRRQLGEKPALEEYRQRFPDFVAGMALAVQGPLRRLRQSAQPGSASTVAHAEALVLSAETAPTLPPNAPTVGTRFAVPGYEILEELGRGGMGIVYKAWQIRLKRLVALKMIRDSAFAGPEQQARFRREAEAVARLQHANVVQIHEIGEYEDRPFFSMELAEGGNLATKLAGQPLSAREAVELVRTLALAVDHAHARNVIHRDLKPANVLLTGEGRLLLTDFGLAKLLDRTTVLSQSGAVMGTASYMAPEQAAGRTGQISPATDLYALGAIFYELLTGRPPFQADNWQATLFKVIHDDPEPPSRLKPGVPAEVENICLKCLAKEPGHRYARAADLAEDLRRFLAGEPLGRLVGPFASSDPPPVPGFEVLDILSQIDPRVRLFKVRELSTGRLACLKMLRELLEADDLERFQKEVLPLLDRLQHPNLVPVYDSGKRGDWLYLVHEFVPGGSLRHRLADQPQPIEESVGLVQSLARTIQVVHDHGLVHGNLEPANVLLADDGTPRIAEVGLVNQAGRAANRVAGAATGTIAWRTSHRNMTNFVGNLRYLAPEVIYSNTGAPSDIYSLGAILYHLLTGRPPFDEVSPMRLMAQVFKQDPAPPRRVRPELPPELEAVCQRCLHKEQAYRYASAGALAEDLQRFLGSGTLPSEASGFWQSLLSWWKPRRSR